MSKTFTDDQLIATCCVPTMEGLMTASQGDYIIKGIKGEESLAENIIEYATKVEGDLIMIMTQQEVDFTQYFIGSSAQEIINHSTIPVLSIRPLPKKDTTTFPNPY